MQRVADLPDAPHARRAVEPRCPRRTAAARGGRSTAAPAGRSSSPPPVEAVRLAGSEFAVDDVARSAGVSKTVIYRYFTDKDELVDAVLERISRRPAAPAARRARRRARRRPGPRCAPSSPRSSRSIEDEPELYRFAYAHAGRSGRADLVAATEHEIAEALAGRDGRPAGRGRPPHRRGATTWAYGVVGMVQLAAHWWSTARTVPAAELVDQLTALADGGLTTLLPPRRG